MRLNLRQCDVKAAEKSSPRAVFCAMFEVKNLPRKCRGGIKRLADGLFAEGAVFCSWDERLHLAKKYTFLQGGQNGRI